MLTDFDDYFIHQTIDSIDHVANGDPRFQDRCYFNVHGRPGDFLLNCGIGAFPNQNVMDGYICAAQDEAQYNLRASRPLDHDRWAMFAGPLHLEILEPMKRWHLWLDENDHEIAFDLIFQARAAPLEHHPIFQRVDGYVVWHQQHLQQSGVYDGWVKIGGVTRSADGLWGSRDRTWGVRGPQPGTTLASGSVRQSGGSLWMSAQFPDFAVHCWAGKDENGRNVYVDGALARVGSAEPLKHFVDWSFEIDREPESNRPRAARVSFTDEDGARLDLRARPILAVNLLGTGYAEGFFGRKRGTTHVEGERLDFADPAVRRKYGSFAGDVLCEFECGGATGYGVFESQLLAVKE